MQEQLNAYCPMYTMMRFIVLKMAFLMKIY